MMGSATAPRAGLRKAILMAVFGSASAHSWIEWARKMAPNGTLVGETGYARGWVPRSSQSPPFADTIPQWILPAQGQSAYTGEEILNKYDFQANPENAMLEAAPGDFIALAHLENGHTTLPQNQPYKPLNRGTIFIYGTADPKPKERLFDVHLVWNREGTGGDGRGTLLATRNYDDGRCYQYNPGKISEERSSSLAHVGAQPQVELACQSDIKLPDDLKPGSTYTIYWYWDWPNLNKEFINVQNTKNGLFPWAGSFMRGDPNPHHFKMEAISLNESYSSTIDIKITADKSQGFAAKNKDGTAGWLDNQNVYSAGVKDQMSSNFQVDIDAPGGSGGGKKESPQVSKGADLHTSNPLTGTVVVTKTVVVPPPTKLMTVTVTDRPAVSPPVTVTVTETAKATQDTTTPVVSSEAEAPSIPTQTIVVIETSWVTYKASQKTGNVPPDAVPTKEVTTAAPNNAASTKEATSDNSIKTGEVPEVTPFLPGRRFKRINKDRQ